MVRVVLLYPPWGAAKLAPNFSFRFIICMHKDETPMINYIAERLKVGSVQVKSRDVNYIVSSRSDLASNPEDKLRRKNFHNF